MRYILGDPSLLNYSGHCFEYIQSMAIPLKRRGDEVVLVGNRGMAGDFAKRTGAMGKFTYWCDARPTRGDVAPSSPSGRQQVREIHEAAILADLKEVDAQVKFRADDRLVLNTFRHWALRGIVRWLEQIGRERAPSVTLILHFTSLPDPERDEGDGDMYADAFKSIESSELRERFLLLADSEDLIAEYRTLSRLPFALAPIPHSLTGTQPRKEHGQELVRMAYVGEARENKGFHLLPTLASAIERAGLSSKVHLDIQSFIHDPNQEFFRRAMAGLHQSCITLYPDQMDEAAYASFLDSADAILAPYRTPNYHSQTSGIYSEAVARGIPVVVSRGTWMARQVKKLGGGVLCVPDDPYDFSEAALHLVANIERYRKQAASAAKRWNEFHTAENLLALIDKKTAKGMS